MAFMSTVSRDLPAHPHPDVPKKQAHELLDKAIHGNDGAAVKQLLTAYPGLMDVPVVSGK